jgi:hypothetical protein
VPKKEKLKNMSESKQPAVFYGGLDLEKTIESRAMSG